jgi:hypothetical protein
LWSTAILDELRCHEAQKPIGAGTTRLSRRSGRNAWSIE